MGISCEISLCPQSNGKYEYQPGSTVSGAIKYRLSQGYTFKCIIASLKGQGKLYFLDKYKRRHHNFYYRFSNREMYIDIDNIIHKGAGKPFPAGEYETPFSFQMPYDVPASLQYMKHAHRYICRCNIWYYIRIKFEWEGFLLTKKHFKKDIHVISGQTPRMTKTPLMYGEQKSLLQLSSLFTRQKHIIILKTTIANSVLRPGKSVKLDYEVENKTEIDIKRVKVTILEVDSYTSASGRKAHVKSEVKNTGFTYGSIKSGETAAFTAEIVVPILCASFEHSKMFARDYVILSTVVLPVPHINLNLEIPVQVIDRLALNFEGGTKAVGHKSTISKAPPYWEAMKEDKKETSDTEAGPSFQED